jgi:hypothetical protein
LQLANQPASNTRALMPTHTIKRQATDAEMQFLKNLLKAHPTAARRWKDGAENALVTSAAALLALVVIWLGLAWLFRVLFSIEFGMRSNVAIWVVGIGAPICAVYAVVSSIRWVSAWPDSSASISADIAADSVDEEHYEFAAAKSFEEPEHGGLIYFLRTSEDTVLTLYDYEGMELGAQNEESTKSSLVPRSALVMVRAPHSGFVISKTFSGSTLECGQSLELSADPKDWPESDVYCDIPWSELESRLAA